MGALKPWHILILVLLVLLLFGAGKLPSLARNVGKSMRIFKSEVEELRGDDKAEAEDDDEFETRRETTTRTRSDRDGERTETVRRETREYDAREYDARDDRVSERDRVHVREEDSYRRD